MTDDPPTETPRKKRHPGVEHLLSLFTYTHLPAHLQQPSKRCAELAVFMANEGAGNPELTAGLRKLLEAKDCFVRAKKIALEQSLEGLAECPQKVDPTTS